MTDFIKSLFHKYYRISFTLPEILSIYGREFGFVSFDGSMIRHIGFNTKNELTAFIRNIVPRDAYFSCAYYENPDEEMERKNWLGADLIFDIDADHIPTKCERIHDKWVCHNCGFSGKGITPERCPLCASEKLDAETWPCEACLNSAKSEAIKLLDILQEDFGFSKSELYVFFSGHRGYHIHVEADTIKTLDSAARKEIVDYVSGIGFDFYHFINKQTKTRISLLFEQSVNFGWLKRLKEGLRAFLADAKEDDLKKIGLRRTTINSIIQKRNGLLKGLNDINFGDWYNFKGIGSKTFEKLVEHVLTIESAKIDTVVTTDVHRLIRLPETLNSKTGFRKARVSLSRIEDFDPFKDAIAFKKGEVEVLVLDAPKFRIGDEIFGPYKNKKIELPIAAALLLVCRGRAEVVNDV